MRTLRILGTVALTAMVVHGAHGQQPSADEAAVRKLTAEFTAALNKGDGKAAAAVFTEDGDYLSSTGRMARGRAEIEQLVSELVAGAFKGLSFKTTIETVRSVTPDVMIGNGSFEAAGPQPRKGFTSTVAVRQRGQWKIAAIRAMVPAPAQKP